MHQKIDDIQNDLATQHFLVSRLGVQIQLFFYDKILLKHTTRQAKLNIMLDMI